MGGKRSIVSPEVTAQLEDARAGTEVLVRSKREINTGEAFRP